MATNSSIINLFIFIFISFTIRAQELKRDNIWMLAGEFPDHNCGINFNSGFADTFQVNRDMLFFFTNASICDTNGQLLFYTNGNLVCNRFHNYMNNTGGFNPGYHNFQTAPYGQGIYQGALILPKPDHPDLYVIFHESADTFVAYNDFFERPLNLSYSVVDMTQNGGGGAITSEKNVHIIDDTLVPGKLMACKHANGRDWWIVAHKLFTNEYYKILLTPDTIVRYSMQSIGSFPQFYDALGASIFSQDGSMYVNLSYDTVVDILDFDRCTGDFSNIVSFGIPDSNLATLGCALSASGRYLYVSTDYHIFQYDTWAANIETTKSVVSTWDGTSNSHGFRTSFFFMRLAPDNKIYISTGEGTNELHVIDYPDSAGVSCNVRQHGLFLPSYNAFSMPNAVNYSLSGVPGSACDTVYYLGDPIQGVNAYQLFIFPNPASDEVRILFSSKENEKVIYEVSDLLGRIVTKGETQSKSGFMPVDVSALPIGVYFLRVNINSSNVLSFKFTINR